MIEALRVSSCQELIPDGFDESISSFHFSQKVNVCLICIMLRLDAGVKDYSKKMSQPRMTKLKMSQLAEDFSKLKLKFSAADRKAWIKKYQKRRVTCLHCGSTGFAYKLKRHMRSLKCVHARLAKTKG